MVELCTIASRGILDCDPSCCILKKNVRKFGVYIVIYKKSLKNVFRVSQMILYTIAIFTWTLFNVSCRISKCFVIYSY